MGTSSNPTAPRPGASAIGPAEESVPASASWAADALGSGNQDHQAPLMNDFFLAMNGLIEQAKKTQAGPDPVPTLSPFWVTRWERWTAAIELLEELPLSSANDWGASMGMMKIGVPTWFAVVSYSARRAGTLFRPTQLEAGLFGRHFPAPPSCALSKGGRVVDGRSQAQMLANHRPLREYIHEPIALRLEDWERAGLPVRPTTAMVGDPVSLQSDRQWIWGAFCRHSTEVPKWMPSANFK